MKKKALIIGVAWITLSLGIVSCSSEKQKAETTSEQTEEISTTQEEEKEETTTEAEVSKTTDISGEELFASSGCVACHQSEAKTVGPALKTITEAYNGNEDGLKAFLKGEGEAIVDPAQAAVMAPQTRVTKAMSDEERNAIVSYILSI